MPIEKISAAQFIDQITRGINLRAPNLDTAFGPIRDACIRPQAEVLELQNDRVRKLSLLLSLTNAAEFVGYEIDLEGRVSDEGETRSLGSPARTTVTFRRSSTPTSDCVVQRAFPLGTQPDESTAATVTFVTSEAGTLPAYPASESYLNINTGQYELTVPVVATVQGTRGNVGAGRLTRPLRPLNAFDSVTNLSAAAGGMDKETIQELIDRYLLSIIGQQTGVPNGVLRVARAGFPEIDGLKLVYGTNALLTRAAVDAGAVDAWVKGSSRLTVTDESHTFLGTGQLIPANIAPLVSVVSVTSGGTPYLEDADYEVVSDVSGVSGSPREAAGIRFLAGAGGLPAVGDPVLVTYTYNNLIRALQSSFETEETLELGRDLLFRQGVEVALVHTARLRPAAGFSGTQIQTKVQAAILAFVKGLNLGDDVEASDIQGVVRAISGVDNYLIDRLTRSTVSTGVGDVAVNDNEYPTLSSANLSIAVI